MNHEKDPEQGIGKVIAGATVVIGVLLFVYMLRYF
jgi:hypothetical protein